jgi:hypothetical protein
VIFLFGEIDCREGFLVAVEKCKYENLNEAILTTVEIYLRLMIRLAKEKKLRIFVHPVAPVLNETRPVVMQFNQILKSKVQTAPSLKWLDFVEDLLKDGGLHPDFNLDGTHLHPNYLRLLEAALNRI